jgi:hypothetical protein
MLSAALFVLLALPARAQEPAPAPAPSPAAAPTNSTDTAVDLSTGMDQAHHGIGVGTGEAVVAAKGKAINVHIHKEAADWDPVSVKVIPDVGVNENAMTRRVHKVHIKGKSVAKGESSQAKTVARLHKYKDNKMLVLSVYPTSLKKLRMHLELRLLISEGYLEGAKLAAVTLKAGQQAVEYGKEDTFTLDRKGLEYVEDFPAEATLNISAISARAGKGSRNAGSVRAADFGGKELGLVNLFYGVDSVASDKGR